MAKPIEIKRKEALARRLNDFHAWQNTPCSDKLSPEDKGKKMSRAERDIRNLETKLGTRT